MRLKNNHISFFTAITSCKISMHKVTMKMQRCGKLKAGAWDVFAKEHLHPQAIRGKKAITRRSWHSFWLLEYLEKMHNSKLQKSEGHVTSVQWLNARFYFVMIVMISDCPQQLTFRLKSVLTLNCVFSIFFKRSFIVMNWNLFWLTF